MRMIPDQPSPTPSRAEKEVFERFRAITDTRWSWALHSLGLPEHERKRVGEIDFLLAGREGLLVLEVKGGGVTCREGVWETQDLRNRTHRLRESPLHQASTAMFALEGRLQRLGLGMVNRTVLGCGVVFPNCAFDVASVEWAPETFVDINRLDRLDVALAEMMAHWRAKPGTRSSLSPRDLERYLDVLRPDFVRVPKLSTVARDFELEFVSLTEKQYQALDVNARNARVLYEGGAGTGKTLLAAQLCRQHAAAGRRVLFTCQSEILTEFVRSQPGMDGVEVHPVARVPVAPDTFDAVVVDEAQDVINHADLDRLDCALVDGLRDGNWAMFLDQNNQRGLVGAYDPPAMERLSSLRPASFLLLDNCRNTNEIVEATRERTGADLGVQAAGSGPVVEFVRATGTEATAAVARHLERLFDEGVKPNEVTLLSAVSLRQSVFGRLPRHLLNRLDVLDPGRLRAVPSGRSMFARIGDFKGLESPFVLLESPGNLSGEVVRSHLYVGMTRARVGLWVVEVTGEGGVGGRP